MCWLYEIFPPFWINKNNTLKSFRHFLYQLKAMLNRCISYLYTWNKFYFHIKYTNSYKVAHTLWKDYINYNNKFLWPITLCFFYFMQAVLYLHQSWYRKCKESVSIIIDSTLISMKSEAHVFSNNTLRADRKLFSRY